MLDVADPILGQPISTHRHSYLWRGLASLVGAVVVALGVCLLPDTPGAGWAVIAATASVVGLVFWLQARETLGVYEYGLRLQTGRRVRQILWRELEKVTPRFSYHAHPDTLLKLKLRASAGRKLVLGMDWARRRQLSGLLWRIVQGERVRLEPAPAPSSAAPVRTAVSRTAPRSMRARALRNLLISTFLALPWLALVIWLRSGGWLVYGPGIGLPLLPFIYFATELVTGMPTPELARRWDELGGWQRAALGFLYVAVFGSALLASAFVAGLALTGDLH